MLRYGTLLAILSAAVALKTGTADAAGCSALKLLTSLPLKVVAAGRPGIEVQVAGTPHTFLIDTGGVTGTLARDAVQDLRLKAYRSPRYVITNINGKPMEQTVRAPSIDVGAVHREGSLLYVDDTTPPKNTPGFFDGSLAPDFLVHYDADFDFLRGKFNLFSQDHCPGKVVYWQTTAVAAVPFQMDRAGHVIFQMELDGRGLNAMIDTGSANTNLNLDVARRTFAVDVRAPDVEKIGELKGDTTADIYLRHFKTLSVADVTISNPAIVLMPDMITPQWAPPRLGQLFRRDPELPSIVLGMSVLKMLHVYIAYGEHKLYISAADAGVPAPITN